MLYSCSLSTQCQLIHVVGVYLQIPVSHGDQLFRPLCQSLFARFWLLVQAINSEDEATPQQQLCEGLDLGIDITSCKEQYNINMQTTGAWVQPHSRSIFAGHVLLTDLTCLESNCRTCQDAP